MRKKDIKKNIHNIPKPLVAMGLSNAYSEYVDYCKKREKTHEIIWVKNPPHYKCKAYKVDIWNKKEDLFAIYAETMFGKKEVFLKENLLL